MLQRQKLWLLQRLMRPLSAAAVALRVALGAVQLGLGLGCGRRKASLQRQLQALQTPRQQSAQQLGSAACARSQAALPHLTVRCVAFQVCGPALWVRRRRHRRTLQAAHSAGRCSRQLVPLLLLLLLLQDLQVLLALHLPQAAQRRVLVQLVHAGGAAMGNRQRNHDQAQATGTATDMGMDRAMASEGAQWAVQLQDTLAAAVAATTAHTHMRTCTATTTTTTQVTQAQLPEALALPDLAAVVLARRLRMRMQTLRVLC